MDENQEREVARRSARLYLPISFSAAGIFLLAASLTGDYPMVARIGGTVWVWLLSTIVTMPVITARVKRGLVR
jgi:hypothetical protein